MQRASRVTKIENVGIRDGIISQNRWGVEGNSKGVLLKPLMWAIQWHKFHHSTPHPAWVIPCWNILGDILAKSKNSRKSENLLIRIFVSFSKYLGSWPTVSVLLKCPNKGLKIHPEWFWVNRTPSKSYMGAKMVHPHLQADKITQNVGKYMKILRLEKPMDQLGVHITCAGCSVDPESFRVDF